MPLRAADFESAAYAIPPLRAGRRAHRTAFASPTDPTTWEPDATIRRLAGNRC